MKDYSTLIQEIIKGVGGTSNIKHSMRFFMH